MGAALRCSAPFAILLLCAAAAAGQAGKTIDTVPADFPKDCPVIQNATIRDYQGLGRNRAKVGNILVLDTPAPVATVVEFYKKALPANGWHLLKHPKNPNDELEGTKDGRRVIVGIVATRQGPNPSTTLRLVAMGKQ
jgi:hypothetical protein